MTPTVQAIAWTLIHFCWQAAAIALLYRGLSTWMASRSSNIRYVAALSALLLMLAASLATFAYEIGTFANLEDADNLQNNAGVASRLYAPVITPSVGSVANSSPSTTHVASSFVSATSLHLPQVPVRLLRVIDCIWLLGVLALSLRSAGGWWLLQRVSSSASAAAPKEALQSFRRVLSALGIHRPVALRVSQSIAGPLTVGALRSFVLLPLSAATMLSPEELEVVLAHELAHVRRADFLWNLLQTVVETLFFFHPAVWWIGGCVRRERELCCDDLALEVCPDPVIYASALFRLEVERTRTLQLAMALDGNQPSHTLRDRIARILGEPMGKTPGRGPGSLAAAMAVGAVLLLTVPQVLPGLPTAQPAINALKAAIVPAQSKPAAGKVDVEAVVKPTVAVNTDVAVEPHVAPKPEPEILTAAAVSAQDAVPETDHPKGTYIDRMKAAGYDVDLDKMIAMKVQDITPEYAHAMSEVGFGKLTADQLIACKVQGVTPEFVTQLKQRGQEAKDINQVISFKIFEVTPEWVEGMKAAGFTGMSSDQMVAMRVQGITPEYAREVSKQFPGITAEDLVKSKIFNIDGAFIEEAKKHGFTKLDFDMLVKLRISGILD